ncbi:MAG TPA: hypothetical protein VFR87_08075 [Nocardioidaceae bacterium]|nr:hypothetical protein [Nocardioidaceae bacterium]
MAVWHRSPSENSGLSELFDVSPDVGAHTSMAAEAALLLGVASLLAAPFSVMFAVSAGLAALGLVCGMVGLVTTSRRDVTGSALAPVGLVASLVTLALLGLRYLGVDTAVGDRFASDLQAALEVLNSLLPQP